MNSGEIDNELLASIAAMCFGSWYNHWTLIIIEDVFRDHRSVLPAVGRVKNIDFLRSVACRSISRSRICQKDS